MNHYLIVAIFLVGLLVSACSTPQGPNESDHGSNKTDQRIQGVFHKGGLWG